MWTSVWPARAVRSVPTSTAPTSATADRATTSGRMGTPVKVGRPLPPALRHTSQIPNWYQTCVRTCPRINLTWFASSSPPTDIDECSQSIGHLCTYKCVNVPGSYQCACPDYGYTMSPNGRSCRGEPKASQMHPLAALCLTDFCSEIDFNKNVPAPVRSTKTV